MSEETGIINVGSCQNAICDVVFIHGLDGDIRKTWCAEKSDFEHSWPQWVADSFPRACVWSVGYDAASLKWFGRGMPIVDRATNLLTLCEINGIGRRPVAFIGHSMGGLLIKQMLRHEEYGEKGWQGFSRNTRLVIFVSTPHLGAAVPGYVDALRVVLRPAASIQDLHANDSALSDLNHWFRNLVHKGGIDVASFHETQKTKGVLVVGSDSSDFGYPGIISRPVDADHVLICKPKKRDDIVPAMSSVLIKRFIDKLASTENIQTVTTSESDTALSFRSTTEVDPSCIDGVLSSSTPVKITYHEQIAETVAKLEACDNDPGPLLKKIPYMRNEQDPKKRETAAASYHAGIHDTHVAVRKSVLQNEEYLVRLVNRLQHDNPPSAMAQAAIETFGAFAALRVIWNLKKFYDVEDDKPVIFFESYAFNQDPSYCYLDWAPRHSSLGRRVFGYNYYVGARVGPSEHHYEYVMLPLDVARRIFLAGGGGDAETFYRWILPQLYIVGAYHGVDEFPADDWEIILLQGVGHTEWQSGQDPWKEVRG